MSPILLPWLTLLSVPVAREAPLPSSAALVRPTLGEPRLRWNGKEHELAAGQLLVGEQARAALGAWSGFAAERGYHFELSPDERLLRVLPKLPGASAQTKLVEKTMALCDRWAPLPASRAASAAAPSTGGGIPDDPGFVPGGEVRSFEWSDLGEPESQTAVLFQLRGEDDQAALLEILGARHPGLSGWARSAVKESGFLIDDPLVGAWLESARGREEWSADNELVHRLAQLLFARRFGRLPNWLQTGFAWRVEEELLGGLYCFPHRSEFVFAVEHAAWTQNLAADFSKRGKQPVEPDEICSLARGTFTAANARVAYGMAGFLVEHHASSFSELCEELRLEMRANGRLEHEDGSWELIPDYEPRGAKLLEILEKHAGANLLREATLYFQKGKGYKKPKPS